MKDNIFNVADAVINNLIQDKYVILFSTDLEVDKLERYLFNAYLKRCNLNNYNEENINKAYTEYNALCLKNGLLVFDNMYYSLPEIEKTLLSGKPRNPNVIVIFDNIAHITRESVNTEKQLKRRLQKISQNVGYPIECFEDKYLFEISKQL